MNPPARDVDVLHLITSSRRRGAEVFAMELCEALRRRGLTGQTFSLDGGGDLRPDTEGSGRFDPGTLVTLRRAIAEASVVVAHGSSTLLASYLATRGTGIPFIYRNIGDPGRWADTAAKRFRVGFMLRRAAQVVALWPWAAEQLVELHGLLNDDVIVIRNGVDHRRFRPFGEVERVEHRAALGIPQRDTVVALIGSLTAEKDPLTAVRAVSRMPGVRLLVAGDGPLRPDLEALADSTMPGRLTCLSVVSDVRPVLACADALVLTSLTEGIPAVLVEAGMCAVPAVASDVGGIGEVIEDGVTGILVPPAQPALTAAALEQLLPSAHVFGAAARNRCTAKFAFDAVADQWAQAIRRLQASRPR